MRFLSVILPLSAYLILAGACSGSDQQSEMTADEILALAVSRLPRERLQIEGRILVSRLRGVKLAEMGLTLVFEWAAEPPSATYTISDAFGEHVETVSVAVEPQGIVARSKDGSASVAGRIGESDIDWTDLTFAFLWWKGGKLSGAEEVLGRDSTVIDVPAPANAGTAYRGVRLWMDRESSMPLKGEAYDESGKILKAWKVKGLKRVGGAWIAGELEVRCPASAQRTRIILDTVQGFDSLVE